MLKRSIEKLYLFIIFAFLYTPIITLIIYSFNKSKLRSKWGGFSLRWYESMLSNPSISTALYYTLLVALLSALIATIIGTLAALGISHMKTFYKRIVMNLTYIPVLNPDIVTGISLMLLFIFVRLRLGFTTMLLAHITFNIPYVILCVLPKIKQLNKHTYEAALDLGATKMYAIVKVILPEIMSGVITGFLLAFTLSLDDFVISYFTTGNGVSNLSMTIYTMTKRGVRPEINALSTLMFVSILVLLLIINKRTKPSKKNDYISL
ncbi:MAG: ABC transporter permease [Vallitalea sp.]|jgi:spermidine/putrescine transport system permease protein|nr:ABC transporter permease [Vallitalea sp.]MCT4688532.1 ABC transporter permease [Vallitalea sp.]